MEYGNDASFGTLCDRLRTEGYTVTGYRGTMGIVRWEP